GTQGSQHSFRPKKRTGFGPHPCPQISGFSQGFRGYVRSSELNDVSSQLFGDCKLTGNLAGKARIPIRSERLWRCLLAHSLNHFRPRDETGAWKSLQNCTGAKEMIAVAMGGVDRR